MSTAARIPIPTSTSYQPLVGVLAAVGIGILLDAWLAIPPLVWWICCATALLVWCGAIRYRRDRAATLLVLVAVVAFAAIRHHAHWRCYDKQELGLAADQAPRPVCLRGRVTASSRVRPAPPPDPLRSTPAEEQSSFALEVLEVRDGGTWRAASGRVNVLVDGPVEDVRAGDHVRLLASLQRPSQPLNPGEYNFSVAARRDRRLCQLRVDSPACIQAESRPSAWNARYLLSRLRDHGDRLLWGKVRRDRAGIATAVLLGIRERVDRSRFDNYLTTGTVHLLAISGLHVGILAYGFWIIMRAGMLSRRCSLLLAIALVLLYAALTDARPPVMRAAMLVSVVCVGRLLGRRALEFNTLALAGLIVLLINPTNLFQAGPQLSFLAVATLAASSRLRLRLDEPIDPLDRLIQQSRPLPVRMARRMGGIIWQLWLTSTVIWLVALPLVMWRFNLVSPIAVILNPIVWFPMAGALFAGFGVLLFGWIPPIGDLFGRACDFCLSTIEACIQLALSVPGNHMWVPSPPLWWVVTFYAVLALQLMMPGLRFGPRVTGALMLMWFALGAHLTIGLPSVEKSAERDVLTCSFVAVGHGTSVLLEFPDGRTMLYDAGRLGSPQAGVRPISAVLWDRRVTHIDAVVLSHADIDHYNALPRLLSRFTVGEVYVSPVMFNAPTPALDALRNAIEKHGVPLRRIAAGQHIAISEAASVDVLHPPSAGLDASDNANSIVLAIDYAGRSLLLAGDLEGPGLKELLAMEPRDCDVAMALHHGSGSRSANPPGFAAWSTPEWVIISTGRGRSTAVATAAYQQAGARVFNTSIHGMVRVTISGDEVDVRSYRDPPRHAAALRVPR